MDKPQGTRRRKARRRVMVLLVLCCAVFALFLARLAWLQFAMADHYAQKMAEASSASYTLPQHAARGAITDRSGTVLAQDETVYDVYLRVPAPPGTNLRETVNTIAALTTAPGWYKAAWCGWPRGAYAAGRMAQFCPTRWVLRGRSPPNSGPLPGPRGWRWTRQ